ncbi:MAG: hypothetical protein IJ817_00220 [Clostridia bacterium]|nr:hypothetical protein [Clostridia bacterium]
MNTSLSIVSNVVDFLRNMTNKIGVDIIFAAAIGVEVLAVLFFLFRSAASYEVSLNRALDKINYWVFQKKKVTEENIKNLNMLFKTKAPKRLTYYWHQYVLFREGAPSTYFSAENLIEKPTKASAYKANIKKLAGFTGFWALLTAALLIVRTEGQFTFEGVFPAILLALVVGLIGLLFVLFMSARRRSVLNSLYQNVGLFDRFMDNACQELPTYIDYQILFTPSEIQKGQPVLREFLDFKARKEKEEFNQAKEEQIDYVTYDFSSTGVDGSVVLERAMRESEKFLKKKEKLLVQISQLEAELESRKKNFDNIQRESQTKIQASKENIQRLRQMQEETTNRIESNYYRKQQTQEAAKQEQLEQEFEQQRAKYLLEKGECEEEIAKLNDELEKYRLGVENAMLNEYKTFFDKFCHSAEKVVANVFDEKFNTFKEEHAQDQQKIIELELRLKNRPEGSEPQPEDQGQYDAEGNYVYPNGSFYDKEGKFHDENGNIYSQEGQLIFEAPREDKKQFVDLDELDSFDFMTDENQKEDIYDVATEVVNEVNKDNDIEVINSGKNVEEQAPAEKAEEVEEKPAEAVFEDFSLDGEKKEEPQTEEVAQDTASEQPAVEEVPEETQQEEQEAEPEEEDDDFEYEEEEPIVHVGRPRKIVKGEETPVKKVGRPRKEVKAEPKKKVGRPKKVEEKKRPVGRPRKETKAPTRGPGRPRKTETKATRPVGRPRKNVVEQKKRPVGRPKKVTAPANEKKGRGRPRKESLTEINQRLSEEEARIAQMRKDLNKELETAMNNVRENSTSRQDRRTQIINEIDALQKEAALAMRTNNSQDVVKINEKLEKLLEEIKNLG